MATRLTENLVSDLRRTNPGGYLELECFGGGEYKPGKLLIERHEDYREVRQDPNDPDCPETYSEYRFTVTSFDYGPYQEDEDGEPIESYPEEIVSPPYNDPWELAREIGQFAY